MLECQQQVTEKRDDVPFDKDSEAEIFELLIAGRAG